MSNVLLAKPKILITYCTALLNTSLYTSGYSTRGHKYARTLIANMDVFHGKMPDTILIEMLV